MTQTHPHISQPSQTGASLIEVLVSILILSFGMLSLGAMLSFAVQAPKMSAHRATATNLASGYIERIRANKKEFNNNNNNYLNAINFDGSTIKYSASQNNCTYPNCDGPKLAAADYDEYKVSIRDELPAGGIFVEQDSTDATKTSGNLWILWLEPNTFATLDAGNSDNCPASVKNMNPKPNCLYVRFKL
ncbi:type IV pilus modification protein PilV [Rhodoferax sp.]|uniref:type IV pilus modification protein PilV n=1 Tax=Rhodoferax sp. TaxID=50421 RepID=UPI00263641A0|nr:type IV pilus modification protein PilV [Rhodoferax sp.]MDD2810919.1 type IV pilus modification protein PilV [Rhodoferax sp.]MDD4944260.1 type IV pilus modification protein PilV [Rhodoferax sp.]